MYLTPLFASILIYGAYPSVIQDSKVIQINKYLSGEAVVCEGKAVEFQKGGVGLRMLGSVC